MKESRAEYIFDIFNKLCMFLLAIVTIYPLIYVIFASLSKPVDLMAHTGLLFKPLGFSIESYKSVFAYPSILRSYLNTLFIVVVGVTVNIGMTSLGAYFLSRKDILWKKAIMFFIVATMFFNGGLIPMYLTVKGVGLYDSIFALIIPVSINTTNLIIMRTAFMAVPESLVESATVDGANHMMILFRIMMPIAKPTIATLVLFYGVYHWNAWFNASIFIQNKDLYPIQLILREILIINDTNVFTQGASTGDAEMIAETVKYAVIVFVTLPILTLYPFLQKHFVKGVMIGAIKG